MDIQTIKTFVQVATFENYTKAANEMNYAQSTVTMQLKRLEEELGYPLFERVGRRNYLTAQGRNFLSYANRILSLVQEASSLSDDPVQMKGTLRVGALESLTFSNVLPLIPKFRERYPNAEISVKLGENNELLTMLRENRIDLAWISGAITNDSAFRCLFLQEEPLSFFASSQHPLSVGKHSLEEILTYPVTSTEPSGYCYFKLHELADSHGIELVHYVTVESVHGVSRILHDGESVAFLPSYAVTDPELKRIDADITLQTRHSQLLISKDKWCSPLIEGFTSLIKELNY